MMILRTLVTVLMIGAASVFVSASNYPKQFVNRVVDKDANQPFDPILHQQIAMTAKFIQAATTKLKEFLIIPMQKHLIQDQVKSMHADIEEIFRQGDIHVEKLAELIFANPPPSPDGQKKIWWLIHALRAINVIQTSFYYPWIFDDTVKRHGLYHQPTTFKDETYAFYLHQIQSRLAELSGALKAIV